jgi:hypothetical protein
MNQITSNSTPHRKIYIISQKPQVLPHNCGRKMLPINKMVQIKHKNYNLNSYHFPSTRHAPQYHTLTAPPKNVTTSTDKIPRQILGNLWSVYRSKDFSWKMARVWFHRVPCFSTAGSHQLYRAARGKFYTE